MALEEMLNVWGKTKKVEKIFCGMKNILYLCKRKSEGAPCNPPRGWSDG